MRVLLNLIVVASLLGTSWCGLILHNIRDGLHSKLYGHGLNGQGNPNSPIININNQQQVVQQQSADMPASHHAPSGPRGDYGSLPLDHNAYGSSMDSNFKAGGSKYGGLSPYGHHGDSSYYGTHHHMGGGFRGEMASGISSHQMMKQESYKRPDGPKFGYHHDNNMFGNAQGLSANNNDVPLYPSTSSSSSSSSASSASASSSLGTASSSSASSSASSSSSGGVAGGFRPRSRRY